MCGCDGVFMLHTYYNICFSSWSTDWSAEGTENWSDELIWVGVWYHWRWHCCEYGLLSDQGGTVWVLCDFTQFFFNLYYEIMLIMPHFKLYLFQHVGLILWGSYEFIVWLWRIVVRGSMQIWIYIHNLFCWCCLFVWNKVLYSTQVFSTSEWFSKCW